MSRFLASTSVTAGTLSHEKLRKSPFFADCDAAFLTRLIKDLSVELFTTNEMIMKKGEHADKMYYLMMGEVEILLGNNVRVAKLQEGTVFGEMAMFNHLGNGFSRRSATIRALNFCDTRVINKDRFHAILKQHPKERERFEKIAQERKTKLEKSKDILRPEAVKLILGRSRRFRGERGAIAGKISSCSGFKFKLGGRVIGCNWHEPHRITSQGEAFGMVIGTMEAMDHCLFKKLHETHKVQTVLETAVRKRCWDGVPACPWIGPTAGPKRAMIFRVLCRRRWP